jgi:hypothetical protein
MAAVPPPCFAGVALRGPARQGGGSRCITGAPRFGSLYLSGLQPCARGYINGPPMDAQPKRVDRLEKWFEFFINF